MARAPRDRQRGIAVLLALLFCGALNAIHRSNERSRGHDPVTGIVRDTALVPAQTATVRVNRWFKTNVVSIFQGPRLARQNKLLREKVLALSVENKQLADVQSENDRLRALLDFQRKSPKPLLACEVTALKPSPQTDTVVLNRGLVDGVHIHSVVVASNGALVGQVIDVSSHSSTALILTDLESSVGAQVLPNHPAIPAASTTPGTLSTATSAKPAATAASTTASASTPPPALGAGGAAPKPDPSQGTPNKPVGILKGQGGGQAILTYLRSDANVKPGDPVATSGLSDVYPAGIPIGTVTNVTTDNTRSMRYASIRTSADLDHLDEAFILR